MSPHHLYSHVWTPGPNSASFRIRGTVDALSLALAWAELPRFDLLIALLDADHRVSLIVTDPSPELIRFPARCRGPGLTRPVHGVVLLSMAQDGPDTFSDPSLFAFLQRHYRVDGIRLVDWVQIGFDPDGLRSMRLESRSRRRTARHLRSGSCT